jgi:hypothetical protein
VITHDRNNYAIIGTRFFDLTAGQTVLLAPRKDGSVRFMQIQNEQLSTEDLENYANTLKTKQEVISFFNHPENVEQN